MNVEDVFKEMEELEKLKRENKRLRLLIDKIITCAEEDDVEIRLVEEMHDPYER